MKPTWGPRFIVTGPSPTDVPAYARVPPGARKAVAESIVTCVSSAFTAVVTALKFSFISLDEITVPDENVWVTANLKETQLAQVQVRAQANTDLTCSSGTMTITPAESE